MDRGTEVPAPAGPDLERREGRRPGRRRRAALLAWLLVPVAVVAAVLSLVGGKPEHRLYWGAWIGDQFTGEAPPWDMSALRQFQDITGKPPSVVHLGSPFANCAVIPCRPYAFPTAVMQRVRDYGAIPFLSWASQSTPSSPVEPDYQLSDVIAGRHDAEIVAFATAAKAWGHPFFLRFNHEMNLSLWPWSEQANGNQPGEFVRAWRHVHDLFRSVGATNATWVWCPDVARNGVDLAKLYPGDDYVDWTCLDGYNFGTSPVRGDHWRSFDEAFGPAYREVAGRIAPKKPMIIGEVASTEYGGSKAKWISDLLDVLPTRYPKIRGVLWFEKFADQMDWPIVSSTTAAHAFAKGIGSSAFAGAHFGDLDRSPIPPPS